MCAKFFLVLVAKDAPLICRGYSGSRFRGIGNPSLGGRSGFYCRKRLRNPSLGNRYFCSCLGRHRFPALPNPNSCFVFLGKPNPQQGCHTFLADVVFWEEEVHIVLFEINKFSRRPRNTIYGKGNKLKNPLAILVPRMLKMGTVMFAPAQTTLVEPPTPKNAHAMTNIFVSIQNIADCVHSSGHNYLRRFRVGLQPCLMPRSRLTMRFAEAGDLALAFFFHLPLRFT